MRPESYTPPDPDNDQEIDEWDTISPDIGQTGDDGGWYKEV